MAEYPQLLHTVLDTTRPRELAEFYRQLLGLSYRTGDEPPADGETDAADWLVLVDSEGLKCCSTGRPTLTSRCSYSQIRPATRSASSFARTFAR